MLSAGLRLDIGKKVQQRPFDTVIKPLRKDLYLQISQLAVVIKEPEFEGIENDSLRKGDTDAHRLANASDTTVFLHKEGH